MVWGLVRPSGFGDFFPGGDYVGWNEKLKQYYDNEMSEAEKAEMGISERILYSKFSNKFAKDAGPLKLHECPTEFRTVVTYKSLGSFIKLTNRLMAVDEPLKEIIEALEPDVHQFWPIRITMPKDKEYPVPYYGLVIRRFLDSFVPEQSVKEAWREMDGSYFVRMPSRQTYSGLAMSQAAIGNVHLWRERNLLNPEVLFSDALQAEIDRRALRIPKHYRLKVV